MCKPASFVVLKDRVAWSRNTDSHEEMIREFDLHEGADPHQPNYVRIEITPPGDDLARPLAEWQFRVDQDRRPTWFDAEDAERRCRAALAEWYLARVVTGIVARLTTGSIYLVGGTVQSMVGGTVQSMYGGTVQSMVGGTVQSMYGGTVQSMEGGTVQSMYGGTVQSMEGDATVIMWRKIKVPMVAGSRAVIVDRSGERPTTRVAPKAMAKKTAAK